jgi:nucleoside-diphosphate-sugar epimerase
MTGLVLITGSSGFVGRHLTIELKRIGVALAPTVHREVGPETDWASALVNVDAVIHLAALAHERAEKLDASRDYEPLRRVNVLGAERLARAAAAARVRRFIFLSTVGVCGDETVGAPLTEESPEAPRSFYAASKLEAEQRLRVVSHETGLRVTILRPTLVYGPGNGGNMLRLLRVLDRGWPLPFGGLANRRTLTHVRNLVSAISTALQKVHDGGTFVICDHIAVSTPEILRCMAAGMGRSVRLLACPRRSLQMLARLTGQQDKVRRLIGSLEADSGKFARAFGWLPPVSPQDGLYETGRWFRSHNTAGRSG